MNFTIMKINAVISTDIIKKEKITENKISIINFSVLASAIVCGTLLYVFLKDYFADGIFKSFTSFFSDFSNKTNLEIISGIALSHLPYILLMMILGTSACGCAIIVIISFIKVAGLGILAAYFYSSFALKGIEYALLVFFPGKFVLILSVLFMMHFCTNNSLNIKSLIKGECRAENMDSLYNLKSVIAILLFILSSAIDGFTVVSFSSLFAF
ncbi:MAG: hypothetical protein E7543_00960 [Ruminococcaceae bacterium]|nr:hypothetical protein [Oscillospiraceae bacterium]